MMATPSNTLDRLGNFQVLGLLGTGGMGEVFLGRREGPSGFSRAVVLKRLLPHLARVQSVRRMFLDEARIVARIRHRNVVQVEELCEDGDELFIVMEYLEGESLGRLMRKLAVINERVPYREAVFVIAEVAAGLHAAHTLVDAHGRPANVIHRDVSLSNVFVTYDGQVKLIDFGIAKAENRLHKTEPGMVRGTTAYMSPEQITGLALDTRSDIFSLGVVLYELTTLRRLFKRKTLHATYEAILREPIRPLRDREPDYPPALEDICFRCLERPRENRYQDCEALRRDLLEVLDDLPGEGNPPETIAGLMHTRFDNEIEAQKRMLKHLERGEAVAGMVAEPSHEEFEFTSEAESRDRPAAVLPPTRTNHFDVVSNAPTTPSASLPAPLENRGRNRSWSSLLILLAGVGTFVLAGWWVGEILSSDASRATVVSTTAIPSSPPPSPLPARIRIETEPPGAAVHISGTHRGLSPLSVELPRTEQPIMIMVSRDGYSSHAMSVIPNAHRDVMVVLQKQPPKVEVLRPERLIPEVPAPSKRERKKTRTRKKTKNRRRPAKADPVRSSGPPKPPTASPPPPAPDYKPIDDWGELE